MKIVIAGAGDLGFHLANLLAHEKQDIVLIDTNQDVLDYAATHLDVFTLRGDASSVAILQEADVANADLVLAMTTSEKTNLITAVLSKKFGAQQAIARVENVEYLRKEQRDIFRELGVDRLISPVQLAANEIERLLKQCELTDIFEFEGGTINLIGFSIDENTPERYRTVGELLKEYTEEQFRPVAILRKHETIIPREYTRLFTNDHLYFLAGNEQIESILKAVGKVHVKVKNVMILGGSSLAYRTAQLLEDKYNVTIVEGNKEKCKYLADKLDQALIIKADPSNIEVLREEGLSDMDAFIALTPNSETNIITSLMAESCGVYKTVALVDNMDYTHISQNIGVDTLINKKLIAANNIFRFVRKGKIEAITSLHGVDAEIIEYVVHKSNKLTKHPLKKQHFPGNAVIGAVIRGKECIIPTGEFQLEVDDKVIVFAMPDALGKLEQIFR